MMTKGALLLVSGCVAMLMATLPITPHALAQQQQGSARDAAMVKCIAQAHKQFTTDSEDMQRADFYKACMTRAGFQP
jgi:hypothetical protein